MSMAFFFAVFFGIFSGIFRDVVVEEFYKEAGVDICTVANPSMM